MSDPVYPKGEHIWTGYYNTKQELLFIVTTKGETRDWYYLYEYEDGKLKKLGKARNPVELEEKYNVCERMRKE